MDRLIYVAMTGAKQLMQAQGLVSNNLANAATNGFYRDTRATLEGAWVRPRHDGYMAFQQEASDRVNAGLRRSKDGRQVVADLNRLFRDSFSKRD